MTRDVETVAAGDTLRDAATQLARRGIHGAPVVDATGRCVGVLSVSDLARSLAARGEPLARPQTCSFRAKCREPGGREVTVCRLPEGNCPLQRLEETADRSLRLVCTEPHCVPTDWQMVELESLPGDRVSDYMTTEVVTVAADAPAAELARVMLDHGVHRLVVLDSERRPVGVIAVNDLLRVLAQTLTSSRGNE
jgi:CBS domain-containing protein